jgi:hypothetical protein
MPFLIRTIAFFIAAWFIDFGISMATENIINITYTQALGACFVFSGVGTFFKHVPNKELEIN